MKNNKIKITDSAISDLSILQNIANDCNKYHKINKSILLETNLKVAQAILKHEKEIEDIFTKINILLLMDKEETSLSIINFKELDSKTAKDWSDINVSK